MSNTQTEASNPQKQMICFYNRRTEEGEQSWPHLVPLEADSAVLVQFINITDDKKCLPSYETFNPFDPEVEHILRCGICEKYISPTDFDAFLGALNAVLEHYRSRSKFVLFLLVILTLASILFGIFVHFAVGLSFQVFILLVHAGLQSLIRNRCLSVVTDFLAEEINEPLRAAKSIYFEMEEGTDGCCSNWFILSLCKEVEEQLPNPLINSTAVAIDVEPKGSQNV